jgi:hypothetical protein
MAIDSYRFLDFAIRMVMKAWAGRQEPGVVPFTPLAKPLRECTVALVSTAGVARNDGRPFDQEGERRDPWWAIRAFARFLSARRKGTSGCITCTSILASASPTSTSCFRCAGWQYRRLRLLGTCSPGHSLSYRSPIAKLLASADFGETSHDAKAHSALQRRI